MSMGDHFLSLCPFGSQVVTVASAWTLIHLGTKDAWPQPKPGKETLLGLCGQPGLQGERLL